MNRFVIMSLAFIVAMPIGLGYADDSFLDEVSTAPHRIFLASVPRSLVFPTKRVSGTSAEEIISGGCVATSIWPPRRRPVLSCLVQIGSDASPRNVQSKGIQSWCDAMSRDHLGLHL